MPKVLANLLWSVTVGGLNGDLTMEQVMMLMFTTIYLEKVTPIV